MEKSSIKSWKPGMKGKISSGEIVTVKTVACAKYLEIKEDLDQTVFMPSKGEIEHCEDEEIMGGFSVYNNKGFNIQFQNGIYLSTRIEDCDDLNNDNANHIESYYTEVAIFEKDHSWKTPEMIKDIFPNIPIHNYLSSIDIEAWLKIFEWCKNYKS